MEPARTFKIIVNSKECGTCSGSSPSVVAKKVVKPAPAKKAAPAPAPVVVEATVVAPTLFAEPTTDTPTA